MMARLTVCLCAVFLLAGAALAQHDDERVQYGHDIVVRAGEHAGDLVCIGCSIFVHGDCRDAVAVGGSIELDGHSGDVVAVGGSVTLGTRAEVSGDVVTVGGAVARDPAAVVRGDVSSAGVFGHHPIGAAWLFMVSLLAFASGLVVSIVLALLAYLILGEPRITRMASAARMQTGRSFLVGLAVFVAACALIVFSSFFGPLVAVVAPLIAIAIVLALAAGYTGLSATIGQSALHRSFSLSAILIGVLIITLLQSIPLLGLFAVLIFVLLAAGVAVSTGFGASDDWIGQRFARPMPPQRPA